MARLFFDYANCSSTEIISLKATLVLPSLLLQRPHPKLKDKENISCLERRLNEWSDGHLSILFDECKQIQSRLRPSRPYDSDTSNRRATAFANLVFQGKIKNALRLLDSSSSSRILLLNDPSGQDNLSVLDCLHFEHPQGQPISSSDYIYPLQSDFDPHPVIFEKLTGSLIKSVAHCTRGSAGPSGIDAAEWRRLCSCFKRSSDELCSALAAVARRLCSEYVDPAGLSTFVASRLIALDKNPGVRPIGVGMYALATIPLVRRLHDFAKQVWYADDAAACDTLSHLRQWWDLLIDIGPSYGYFPNSRKTYLLVKPECVDEAKSLFSDTMVNITDAGHRYLGSVIGSDEYVNSFVEQKIDVWNNELLKLVEFADSQPHASFAALTHGLFGKWFFLTRTTPNIAHLFQPLETTIRSKLLPVLLGQGPPNDSLRDLIFSATGGLGKAAHFTFCRLASLLSVKWDDHYNQVISWLRCHISFSLLRSAISCICGSRTSPIFDYHSISIFIISFHYNIIGRLHLLLL